MRSTRSSDWPETLREQAAPERELAALLGSETGLMVGRLLGHAGLIAGTAPQLTAASSGPEAIGPWSPSLEDGKLVFVRELQAGLDTIWWRPTLEREVLRPKQPGDATRVCLIGESAAAGMFYTPHYTPALALAECLGPRYEVLDLTRNAMNANELVATTRASLQLSPDLIVVYAGNNWFAGLGLHWEGDAAERRDYVDAMTAQGTSEVVRTFQRRLRELGRATIAALAELGRSPRTRLVLVVPPVNLRWERAEPPVWLGRGRTARWYACHARALDALSRNELAKARELVDQMSALDEGRCPTTHRLRGKIQLALGRPADAADAFELELEHANALELFCQPVPGAPRYLRDEMRSAAADHALEYVDVPRVFEAHSGSPLLRSELFIDYCHLSPEGMRLAMAAVARTIECSRAPEIAAPPPVLTPRVECIARFYAAIYTSHMMRTALPFDPDDITHQLTSALREAPEVKELARDYLRARNGALIGNPALSGAGCRVLLQSNNPFLDYAAVRGGTVDAHTTQAIASALDAIEPGSGAAALEEYLAYFQAALDRGVDLTEPVYVERLATVLPYLRYESERETRRALPIFRALAPVSAFTLVSAHADNLELTASWRCAAALARGRSEPAFLVVAVNGAPFARVELSASWTRHSLAIPADRLRAGCNRITVHWPSLPEDDDSHVEAATRRHVLGQRPDLCPVFGEIFSLRARRKRSNIAA